MVHAHWLITMQVARLLALERSTYWKVPSPFNHIYCLLECCLPASRAFLIADKALLLLLLMLLLILLPLPLLLVLLLLMLLMLLLLLLSSRYVGGALSL